MANRYWVNDGVANIWHDANNWSLTSNGIGGAGIPTAIDDVFFDGNGHSLCWPTSDIVCNNMSLLAAMTEMLLIDASAVINGDFLIEAGYFGPTGGPDRTIEFRGNWLKTGGTFAVGTGTGKDPECIFSGIGKTYNLNDVGAATFQNVLVSGEVIFSGTRLGIMNISQKLSITGEMTVNANGLTICDIDLSGVNAGFDVFTGELKGTGRLWYRYRSTHTMVITGTISIKYFLYNLQDAGAVYNIPARQYEASCTVEIEYTLDAQVCRFGAGRHYLLGPLTIHGNHVAINTAELDWDTNTAAMWIGGKFDIYKDAFPNATFNLKLGDNTHVFRNTVDFEFSYASGALATLVVDAGDGTLILWPKGRELISIP